MSAVFRILLTSAGLLAAFVSLTRSVAADESRIMAVTVDDLPTVALASNDAASRERVTNGLIRAFGQYDMPVIGFVNEGKFTENGVPDPVQVELLRHWMANGLYLGNHTANHPDLHRTTLEDYQADILAGEQATRKLLAEYDLAPVWFRHPYLRTGLSLETRDALVNWLSDRGYRVAPVTIDNSEWIFARAYTLAINDGDRTLADRIGREYVDYMIDMVAYYEGQAEILVGRPISQVLLIHANELNADWFGALAGRLVERGYQFVRLEEALEDPVYAMPDEYTGPGGITWLHRWAITQGVDKALFQGEPRTPNYILRMTGLPEHSYEADE